MSPDQVTGADGYRVYAQRGDYGEVSLVYDGLGLGDQLSYTHLRWGGTPSTGMSPFLQFGGRRLLYVLADRLISSFREYPVSAARDCCC